MECNGETGDSQAVLGDRAPEVFTGSPSKSTTSEAYLTGDSFPIVGSPGVRTRCTHLWLW